MIVKTVRWHKFRPQSMMKPSRVCSQLVSLRKAPLCADMMEINFFDGIKYCYSSFSNMYITVLVTTTQYAK